MSGNQDIDILSNEYLPKLEDINVECIIIYDFKYNKKYLNIPTL